MKDTKEWTEDEILKLVKNRVKESIHLDYKACASLDLKDKTKNELSKDVSAFANSDGGLLIYGIVEQGNEPERIDEGYDPNVITREWVEQVINSRIQRRIDGIRIYQVDLHKTNPGKVIYVISIPQSIDAPHMAFDKRYYKRFNFESVPMEDYEVRDVRRRMEVSNLRVKLSLLKNADEGISRVRLNIAVFNTSSIPAEYYAVRILLDKRINIYNENGFVKDANDDFFYTGDEPSIPAISLTRVCSVPHQVPIWEDQTFFLDDLELDTPKDVGDTYYVAWKVTGPGFNNFEVLTLNFKDNRLELVEAP
ncbi:ATP-binding protein [Paenibacillus zeisoli]|uniref:ATP-binding protein n=1 Tax=Paenibacillus zeisoli TaxID=2496267 RepID=A0A3S1BAE1_9BACL|nr:ATP-binding protein [Paenibacillus zeisoli]RUT35600.1 ATP-binding protein [Paenibacillus zeisoli]